ncbi:MAG: ABC transporter ATP-binding protein [bacterium]|nr:ABC transporter ATP-binding protein [bacterium]
MQSAIEIKDLVKRYGNVTAVDGVDLTAAAGEMTGLIGPDGAGKTTLLRVLCGLIRFDSGECRLAGLDANRQTAAVRAIVGYMPQRFSLYPDLTVAENLRFFADLFEVSADERNRRLERLLKFSRLGPFSDRKASALSGGMKQKLALSCTLIHTPKVLLLDEPTTGVDPVSRREFWDILSELRGQGVSILVTTPYMDEAGRCDRVALMHKGRILLTDKPADVPKLFRNTLVEVECGDPARFAKALSGSGRFHSVQAYGDRIHVSGPEKAESLEAMIRATLAETGAGKPGRIGRIRPGIEDTFVELMAE